MAAALVVVATIVGAGTFAAVWTFSPGLALVSAPLVASFVTLVLASLGAAFRRPRRHGIRNYSAVPV
jgi:hypothetical protein